MKSKIVLGLSGGVDSAVAARLLRDRGYEVHSVYLDNGVGDPAPARETAAALGLPFRVFDIRNALNAKVCRPFYESYLRGETPSPCALCNPSVKFPVLLAVADELGAAHVATGHYARAEDGRLLRGRPANDQSYLLARLTAAQLERIVFPLGGYEKTEVRALAEAAGLSVAKRPDSMEICFIPDGDYAAWLDRQGETPPPGDFIDRGGNVLGRHKGIHHYTLGQRRGLSISAAHRLFVSDIRPEDNTVVLSDGTDLLAEEVWGTDWNPLAPMEPGQSVTVRLRHSKTQTPARFYPTETGARLELEAPARAPTPGQLAACYAGDKVLGSFWITGARRQGCPP